MFDRLRGHTPARLATRDTACASHWFMPATLGALLLLGGCSGDDSTASSPSPVAATHTLSGTVSGLPSGTTGLVLANGNATLAVAGGSETFSFPVSLVSGTSYIVTIQSSPTGMTCSIASFSGTITTANVSNVVVTCSDRSFSVGGQVTGLNGSGLVLANGTDTITLAANATSFSMPAPVAYGGSYAVTVKTEPAGVNCSIASGSGTVPASNVSNIVVTCTDQPFTVGGSIAGLNGGGLVLANGLDTLTVPANATSFTLPTGVDFSATYAVTIQAQPSGITCTLSNASGTMPAANVTSVVLTCSDQAFTVGGTLTGLTSSGLVLANGTDTLVVPANATTFTMHTPVAFKSAYAITVHAQPTGLFCTASSATGTTPASNVTSVVVTCSPNFYTLGGTISGLTTGGLVLSNGTDTLAVAANATTFTLPTAVASGAAYDVIVAAQPAGSTCMVTNGSGSMGAHAVTSVNTVCTANPQFAYSADYNDNLLFEYTVDPSTNLLSATPTASFATGVSPFDAVASPSGGFVYTANRYDNTISVFGVDPTSGALNSVGTANTISTPYAMVINAAGTFAYAVGQGSGLVGVYSIGSDGNLTPVNGGPFDSGASQLLGLALNPAGTVLYVASNSDNIIQAMSIDTSTGALTQLGSQIPAGNGPSAIVVNPAGTYAYVASTGDNAVSEFGIGMNGTLTALGTIPTDGSSPIGIAIDPTGQFVYTANNGAAVGTPTAVSAYSVGMGGALTSLGAVATGLFPATVTVNPAGNTLYAVDNQYTGSGTTLVYSFSINPSTGVLTPIGSSAGNNGSALNSLVIVTPQ